VDTDGHILIIGAENHLPYDRPPLTKKLWFGKQKLEDITLHDRAWYEGNGVELLLGVRVKELDAANNRLLDDRGDEHSYEKLLIATGGSPRLLDIPGGDTEGVCYYRTVDDYLATRGRAEGGRAALVVGGGFIGSELAACLHTIGAKVTMVLRGTHLVPRVFPEGLGSALQANYQQRGITILAGDDPTSVERGNGSLVARTRKGH
jgi:NAD(P)H-nitrite reductase large subunit